MGSRLALALENGDLTLPEAGRIAVFGPPAAFDLSPLPQDRVHVIQTFYPDHQAWQAQGYDVSTSADAAYAMAIVVLPRAKLAARDRIAQAAACVGPDGLVVVDGQKTDGADSLIRAVKADAPLDGVFAKNHGKLFWFRGRPMPDWLGQEVQIDGGFVTRPGVFSADGPDRGSVLLAGALPEKLGAHIADFGAGWGYLSRAVLARSGVETLALYEADHTSLACAKRNIDDPRASFHWADVTDLTAGPFDTIVMNPPFHTGRAGDPDLGRAFIAAAAACLRPSGTLWLVANRHLPYEAALDMYFVDLTFHGDDPGFKICAARRPRRQPAKNRPPRA